MPAKLSAQQFIDRSVQRHGGRYEYHKVEYSNVTTKVEIVCPTHGSFHQTPKDHMHKYGCPKCGGTGRVSQEEFVTRARATHGNTYDYTQTLLRNMNQKVLIGCVEHGTFLQRPADHLDGVGCPTCGKLKQGGYTAEYFKTHPERRAVAAHLYVINIKNQLCKIGITAKEYVKQRFPGLDFIVVASKEMTLFEAFLREQEILQKYRTYRYKTKDLQMSHYTGWTECFPLSLQEQLAGELV